MRAFSPSAATLTPPRPPTAPPAPPSSFPRKREPRDGPGRGGTVRLAIGRPQPSPSPSSTVTPAPPRHFRESGNPRMGKGWGATVRLAIGRPPTVPLAAPSRHSRESGNPVMGRGAGHPRPTDNGPLPSHPIPCILNCQWIEHVCFNNQIQPTTKTPRQPAPERQRRTRKHPHTRSTSHHRDSHRKAK